MSTSKPKFETLHCVPGDHEFQREIVRGRKPTACPEHKPVPAVSYGPKPAPKPKEVRPTKETLFCVPGNHEWERQITRGRRPQSCPDHRSSTGSRNPVDAEVAMRTASDSDLELVRRVREDFAYNRKMGDLHVKFLTGKITAEERREQSPMVPLHPLTTDSDIKRVRHLLPELQR